jgi:hypothetical protein
MSFQPAHPGPLFSLIGASTMALVVAGCGGQKEAEAPPESAEAPADEPEDDVSADEAALLEEIEASAEIADAQAAAGDGGGDGEREVVYRLSQDGLKVQVDGATFIPKAEAVKVAGRWGVKLTLEATTESDKVLSTPKKGPMAFGGFVERSSKSPFGDKREGDAEVTLTPDKPQTFTRTWPDSDQQGLAPGEKLELQVGLWGLGADSASKKPVRRFFVVKMVADRVGAQPLIQPPE